MLHFPDRILTQLKTLYGEFEPKSNEDGASRTITFCISEIKADDSVARPKDVWIPGSFLQQWMLKTRALRFGEMGGQACRILIDEVDQVVKLSNENLRVEVLKQVEMGTLLETFDNSRPSQTAMLAVPFDIWF